MGLRHVVALTFEDDTTAETIANIVDRLRALPGLIDEIESYVVGTDIGLAPGNASLAIVADFASVDGYITYRDHPEHHAVIAIIAPVVAARSALQHEI